MLHSIVGLVMNGCMIFLGIMSIYAAYTVYNHHASAFVEPGFLRRDLQELAALTANLRDNELLNLYQSSIPNGFSLISERRFSTSQLCNMYYARNSVFGITVVKCILVFVASIYVICWF